MRSRISHDVNGRGMCGRFKSCSVVKGRSGLSRFRLRAREFFVKSGERAQGWGCRSSSLKRMVS